MYQRWAAQETDNKSRRINAYKFHQKLEQCQQKVTVRKTGSYKKINFLTAFMLYTDFAD